MSDNNQTIYHSEAIESPEGVERDVHALRLVLGVVDDVKAVGGIVYVSRGFETVLPHIVMVLPGEVKPGQFLADLTWTIPDGSTEDEA